MVDFIAAGDGKVEGLGANVGLSLDLSLSSIALKNFDFLAFTRSDDLKYWVDGNSWDAIVEDGQLFLFMKIGDREWENTNIKLIQYGDGQYMTESYYESYQD